MENTIFKKANIFNVIDIIKYQPHSMVTECILKKNTGNITAVSFDSGVVLKGKISPFDNLLQIIEGNAEVIIDDTSHHLKTGQSIIIPSHSFNMIKANKRFKMLSIIIKHGYEDVIL